MCVLVTAVSSSDFRQRCVADNRQVNADPQADRGEHEQQHEDWPGKVAPDNAHRHRRKHHGYGTTFTRGRMPRCWYQSRRNGPNSDERKSQSYRRGERATKKKLATRRNGVVGNTGSTAPAAESVGNGTTGTDGGTACQQSHSVRWSAVILQATKVRIDGTAAGADYISIGTIADPYHTGIADEVVGAGTADYSENVKALGAGLPATMLLSNVSVLSLSMYIPPPP